jgi:hypothetical protein
MLFDLLALFAFLVVLLLLRRLLNIFPSLLACLIRGKESLNLEASVKLSRDRDALALAMIVPFCLVAFRYRLYAPGFLDGFSENSLIGIYFAVFFAYVLLRSLMKWLMRPRRMQQKVYAAASKASSSFFIIGTLLLLATGGLLDLFNVPETDVRSAMLWVSAFIYAVFLLRKTQIFSTSCSVFVAFLYLCALEMIPTGILVVSAIIF